LKRPYSQLPVFFKLVQPLLVLILLLAAYLVIKVFLLSPRANAISYNDSNSSVLGLNIPSNLHFCGEKIPSNDFEIRQDLEKEFFTNSYWKNNSLALFHKAQRWFPYIEPILKAEGIPDDFKYLAVIESHLSNANSPVGAAGFWQLVPGTAMSLGLEVNANIDERYDVEKSTHAACQLIKQAYKVFNNWTLTAAAYNRGIGGILKAMKQQKTRDYHELILNPETGSFVYRILAYKTLFSSPGHFGIKRNKWTYYPRVEYSVLKVDSSLHSLAYVAAKLNTTPLQIRLHNPWLLQDQLINSGKVYSIKFPKKKGDYSGYLNDLSPNLSQPSDAAVTGTETIVLDSLTAPLSATLPINSTTVIASDKLSPSGTK
jgi:hypothetical protein